MKISRAHAPLALLSLLLIACGGGTPVGAPPAVAESPDQAILNVAQSIENKDPSGIWHALPGSYQGDLKKGLQDFAGAMDAEVWSAGAGTFGKLVEVLETQKEFLLSSQMVGMMGGRGEVEDNYDPTVRFFTVIKESALMDLDQLGQTDPGEFLATTGAELMRAVEDLEVNTGALPAGLDTQGLQESFAGLEAELLSQEGDEGVVRITTPDVEPEDVDFVRVEGKWIPAEMAEDWPEMMQGMREGIQAIQAIGPEEKSQVMMMTTMANGILDQLLAAETQEQFDSVLGGLMGMMGGM